MTHCVAPGGLWLQTRGPLVDVTAFPISLPVRGEAGDRLDERTPRVDRQHGRGADRGMTSRIPIPRAPDSTATDVVAWVARAQAGDAEAFGQIYDRYLHLVYRFIYFRVGSRPLAEDLTADTFLRALKRIGSFTWQGRDLGAWLVTIARNLVADHFKSGRYRLEVTTGDVVDADLAGGLPRRLAVVVLSAEDAALRRVEAAAVRAAMAKLTAPQRRVLELRFLAELSCEETAAVIGSNVGAVKALQYRAVAALRRCLCLEGSVHSG